MNGRRRLKSPPIWLAILALVLLSLGGCGSDPTPAYIGTWIGHYPVPSQPGVDPSAANTASLIQLTIKPDSHFQLYDSGVPREGDYDQFGDHGVLTTKKALGKDLAIQPPQVQANYGQIRVVSQPNGNLLYVNPNGFAPNGIELHRLKPGEPSIQPVGS